MKNLVRQQASEIIEEAPALYKVILDKMAEDAEFQQLILTTPDRDKALVLQRMIKEIKGEPDERTEALDAEDEDLKNCVTARMETDGMTREEAVAWCKEHQEQKSKVPTAQEIFEKISKYAR